MLEYVAIAIMALGLFLLIRGITETVEVPQTPDVHPRPADFDPAEETGGFEFEKEGEVKAGGVVLIGPIPIVFGDSKYATYALILTLVVMLISIILWVNAV
ncbi:TIGR00304 family membrane protein [Geoglobus acetivorans]|uniref:TIGR00304 family protein n=1 Tax=Geoglobus acetivorans TaxID=565033 RepID=A0A0A7GFH2_GEOAI|nr:hypothetical protein GACE_1573 [Geoglobus acetivorans]